LYRDNCHVQERLGNADARRARQSSRGDDLLTLDPAIIPELRQGLFTLLASDAELMAGALVTSDWDPRELSEPRERTERCWALLDAIGWDGAPVELELREGEHAETAREACAAIAPLLEEWLAETPADDPRVAPRVAALAALRDLEARLV
jgi:hypothetical protein